MLRCNISNADRRDWLVERSARGHGELSTANRQEVAPARFRAQARCGLGRRPARHAAGVFLAKLRCRDAQSPRPRPALRDEFGDASRCRAVRPGHPIGFAGKLPDLPRTRAQRQLHTPGADRPSRASSIARLARRRAGNRADARAALDRLAQPRAPTPTPSLNTTTRHQGTIPCRVASPRSRIATP